MSDDIFEVVRRAGGGGRLTIESELRRRRERFADMFGDEGDFAYMGIGDVLERFGQRWEGGQTPDQYEHLRGPMTYCFTNSLSAAEECSDLRYFEGLYLVGASAVNHGWCVDPNDELVELTFPIIPSGTPVGLEQRPVDPPEKWQYIGVCIPVEYARSGSWVPVLDDVRPYKRDIFKRPWRWNNQGREIT